MSQHLLCELDSIKVSLDENAWQCDLLKCPTDLDCCYPILGLVSAGSGITTMLSLIDFYLSVAGKRRAENVAVNMKIRLIGVNTSIQDQMGNANLVKHVRESQGILEVIQLTSRKVDQTENLEKEFTYAKGKITPALLKGSMPTKEDANRALIVVSGPTGFVETVGNGLNELEIPDAMIRNFC
jgi:ferredoxin-NADP reductase